MSEWHKGYQEVQNKLNEKAYKNAVAPASSKANMKQIFGTHYTNENIQPWDFIIANEIPYLEGNIIKYICRWRSKGGLTDLAKAQHYIEKLIEVNTDEG